MTNKKPKDGAKPRKPIKRDLPIAQSTANELAKFREERDAAKAHAIEQAHGRAARHDHTRTGSPNHQSLLAREIILGLIANGTMIGEAIEAAGITRQSLSRWRKTDDEFERRFLDAIETSTELLEGAAYERAISGKSDLLLMFLMKARKPDIYREKQVVQHTHQVAPGKDFEAKFGLFADKVREAYNAQQEAKRIAHERDQLPTGKRHGATDLTAIPAPTSTIDGNATEIPS